MEVLIAVIFFKLQTHTKVLITGNLKVVDTGKG